MAGALAAAWADAVEARTGTRPPVDEAWLERVVLLPALHGEAVAPAAPHRLPGGDTLHCDLASDEDEERFAAVLDLAPPDTDAEAVALLAQDFRLPVTPYRRRCRPATDGRPGDLPIIEDVSSTRPAVAPSTSTAAPVVVDLTSLWAGPLATRLLAATGAEVVKIEPACRPDGVRDQPLTYAWLNEGKEVLDLDLRRDHDRARFEALVAHADIVVSSFSRRVMPNFGYDHDGLQRIRPGIVTVAVHAFPSGSPERDWVAYGGGVHAASGLGDDGTGGWWQPAVSYPDPLAGLAAAGAVERALAARDRGWPVRHGETTLWAAAAAVVAADRPHRR